METNEKRYAKSLESDIKNKIRSNHSSPHLLKSPVFSPLDRTSNPSVLKISRNNSGVRSPSLSSTISSKSNLLHSRSPYEKNSEKDFFRYYNADDIDDKNNNNERERLDRMEKIIENLSNTVKEKDKQLKELQEMLKDDGSVYSNRSRSSSKHSKSGRKSAKKSKQYSREYFFQEEEQQKEEEEEEDEIDFPDFENMDETEIQYYRKKYYINFQLIKKNYSWLGFKAPDTNTEDLGMIHQLYCDIVTDIEQLEVAEKLKVLLIMFFALIELVLRYLGMKKYKGWLSVQLKTIDKWNPYLVDTAKYFCSKKFKNYPKWLQFLGKLSTSFFSYTALQSLSEEGQNEIFLLQVDKFMCPVGSKIRYKDDKIPDVPENQIPELLTVVSLKEWVTPAIDTFLGDVEIKQEEKTVKTKNKEVYEDVEFE